ncbi:hypothetical protein AALO_G00165450, partial [Alosa alosa]
MFYFSNGCEGVGLSNTGDNSHNRLPTLHISSQHTLQLRHGTRACTHARTHTSTHRTGQRGQQCTRIPSGFSGRMGWS